MTIVVTFGWNLTGGARIAVAEGQSKRFEIYSESFWSRLLILIPAAAIGFTASYLITNGTFALLSSLICLGTLLGGLTFDWFAVGLGKPNIILKYSTIPTVAVMMVSALAVWLTHDLYYYPAGLILGTLTGLTLFHLSYYRQIFPPFPGTKKLRQTLKGNIQPALTDIAGGVYIAMPIPLATLLFNEQSAAVITSADKLYHFSLISITVLGNTLQSWVLTPRSEETVRRRQQISVIAHLSLGFAGAILLVTLGHWVTALLFGRSVAADPLVLLGYALAYLFTSYSTPLIRNILVPAQRNRIILMSTAIAGAVSIPLMLLASASLGDWAIPLWFSLSEFTVAAVLTPPTAARQIRRLK
ncbi:MAG: hypothetical protein ACFWTS_05730 [Pseudoclavibacter caeni]|jgi:hypothetical protein